LQSARDSLSLVKLVTQKGPFLMSERRAAVEADAASFGNSHYHIQASGLRLVSACRRSSFGESGSYRWRIGKEHAWQFQARLLLRSPCHASDQHRSL